MAEEELIAGCRQKDQKAFKVLYNQYAGLLYGIAIRYASNNKEAEENKILANMELEEIEKISKELK